MYNERQDIKIIQKVMIRLLTGNDWFGDGQIREVILDEFNTLQRSLVQDGYAVLDRPFIKLNERIIGNEPYARIVKYEHRWFMRAIREYLKFPDQCQGHSEISLE